MLDDEVLGQDIGQADPPEPPEPPSDPPEPPKPSKPESVRESINRSLKQIAGKPAGEPKQADKPGEKTDKPPVRPGAAAPGAQAGDKDSKATPPQGTPAPQPTGNVPDAWKSKELAPVWQGLTPAVQAAIVKRESDMTKGVEALKTRYQDLDGAVAPYRENIKRFGFTEAQAVDQLFKWQMALAGPDKIRAFVALLQSHGVDPATFAAAITGNRGAAPQPSNGNGNGALPPQVQTELEGIKQKLGAFDQHFALQTKTAAEQTVTSWAKDKPHYNAVRMLMGQLIQSGVAKPSESDPYGLDAAYNMAIHADANTRELVIAEQQAKDAAARKATAEKARKAGSSMRTGAPAPPASPQPNGQGNRNEAVRDSIKRALAELRN